MSGPAKSLQPLRRTNICFSLAGSPQDCAASAVLSRRERAWQTLWQPLVVSAMRKKIRGSFSFCSQKHQSGARKAPGGPSKWHGPGFKQDRAGF